jgi:DNA-directed RNA polymerase specialized sigma24 family protein
MSDGLDQDRATGTPSRPRRRLSSEAEGLARAKRLDDAQLLDRIRAAHAKRSSGPVPIDRPARVDRPPTSEGSQPGSVPSPCPEYEVLANRLFAYAVPLFKHLLRTGLIKKELCDLRLPITLASDDYERLHTSMAARDALAVTVVIAGEDYFRRTVIPNKKWTPDGGASLETFFVNGCLLQFASSVRSWRKEHPEWATTPATGLASEETPDGVADPHADAVMDVVENRDVIDRLTTQAPPMVRVIMQLMLEGYSFCEIGEHLGISTRAVEGRLHRFRTQLKKDIKGGRLDLPVTLAAPDAA